MDKLTGMAIFARVVEAQSFTAAAAQLGMSRSAVSKAIAGLEDRLGARLLNRTTRRLALTEVGQGFYERCARIVAEAEEAELAVSRLQAAPRGTLRLSAPVSFGNLHLAPALPDFMRRYPDVLPIRLGRETVRLPVASIEWVDAAGDYMCVHAEGRTHVVRATMKQFEERLDPADFQRIHRSTIVNIRRIRKLKPHTNGEYFLTLDGGHELKLSRSYRDRLERILGKG